MQSLSRKRRALSRDEAEALAISALSFLASEEHRLASFLHVTGMNPGDLRREAESVGFLAGVLDFITADESLLLVFGTEQHIDPALVMEARHLLLPDRADG
jgi:hypothetical protein